MAYSRRTDRSYTIQLPSSIDRCFWSRDVAYPGESVKIHVEASYVRDGTPLILTILEKAVEEKGEDTQVAEIENAGLSGNALVLDYTIDLPEGPETGSRAAGGERRELFVVVRIPDYGLDNRDDPSPLLVVDTSPFLFSE